MTNAPRSRSGDPIRNYWDWNLDALSGPVTSWWHHKQTTPGVNLRPIQGIDSPEGPLGPESRWEQQPASLPSLWNASPQEYWSPFSSTVVATRPLVPALPLSPFLHRRNAVCLYHPRGASHVLPVAASLALLPTSWIPHLPPNLLHSFRAGVRVRGGMRLGGCEGFKRRVWLFLLGWCRPGVFGYVQASCYSVFSESLSLSAVRVRAVILHGVDAIVVNWCGIQAGGFLRGISLWRWSLEERELFITVVSLRVRCELVKSPW